MQRFCNSLKGKREAWFLGDQFRWHPVLPDPARPRRAPRHDPPVVCPGFGLDKFPDILGIKMFAKTIRRRGTSLHPGMKSAFRPVDEPLTNNGSTAGQPRVNCWFCSPAGLYGNSFVRSCTGTCRVI